MHSAVEPWPEVTRNKNAVSPGGVLSNGFDTAYAGSAALQGGRVTFNQRTRVEDRKSTDSNSVRGDHHMPCWSEDNTVLTGEMW